MADSGNFETGGGGGGGTGGDVGNLNSSSSSGGSPNATSAGDGDGFDFLLSLVCRHYDPASPPSSSTTAASADDAEAETQPTLLFHLANLAFLLSYCAPNTRYGQVYLHAGLIVGYLLYSTWAWNELCAPDVFTWYFTFMLLNMGQLLYILYQLRPIPLDPELDDVFRSLFAPLRVSRIQFKRLVDAAQTVALHSGECYAIEHMTKTDRLGLLVAGKANVVTEKTFLHHVYPKEFLDSPEFESSNSEEAFKVSICAAKPSRCLVWQRTALEYLFVKEPYLAQAVAAVLAHDITQKLFVMNAKMRTRDKGDVLDIRLPGIAGRLAQMDAREHGTYRSNAAANKTAAGAGATANSVL